MKGIEDIFGEGSGFTRVPLEEQIERFEASGEAAALRRVHDLWQRAREEGRSLTWAEMFPDEQTTEKFRIAVETVYGKAEFRPWSAEGISPLVSLPLLEGDKS